jgi:hypothetical protein
VALSNAADADALRIARRIAAAVVDQPERSVVPTAPLDQRLTGWWVDELDGTAIEVRSGTPTSGSVEGHFKGEVLGTSTGAAIAAFDAELRLRGEETLETLIEGEHDRLFRRAKRWQATDLREYAGSYHCEALGVTWHLVPEEGRLLVLCDNQPLSFFGGPPVALVPHTVDCFSGDVTVRFKRSPRRLLEGFALDTARARNVMFSAARTDGDRGGT